MNRRSLFALTTALGTFAALGISVDAQPAVQTAGATWIQQSSAGPPLRFGAGIAYDDSSGSVLLFGGGGSLHQSLPRGDTWSWDGARWTELHPTTNPSARLYPSMAESGGGNGVLLFGGLGGGGGRAEPNDETWTWDGANWTQQQPDASPPARGGAALASDGGGGMVLFGGTTFTAGGSVVDDTWTWDGTTWTQQHPATSPPARAGASMGPDGHGGLILFGGTSSPYLSQPSAGSAYGDLWDWDGANWTQLHPSTSPPGRWDASMTYNAGSNTVVLFGGDNGLAVAAPNPSPTDGVSAGLNDMWTWDGTNWTPQQPTAGPSGRAAAAMAYDPATTSFVIFGGRYAGLGSIGGLLGDTWTWDGSSEPAQATSAGRAASPAAIAPTPAAAGAVTVPGLSPFVGTWQGHQRSLVVQPDGTAVMGSALSGQPAGSLTLKFTSATQTVATGRVIASDPPSVQVGKVATLTLVDHDAIEPRIGGDLILNFCGPQAPLGWCGA